MILAGIDEAGLGPTLGPLVTASAALECPDDWMPEAPWEKLADAFACAWTRNERRPVVADSKVLYASGGLGAMETTLGAFTSALAGGASAAPSMEVSSPGRHTLHPAYSCRLDPFPVLAAPDDIAPAAEAAAQAFSRHGVRAAQLLMLVLHEPALNSRFHEGLNKNEALLMETGQHLVLLAERFPRERVRIVADKQGGRNSYAPYLTRLFPGAWIDVAAEGRLSSRYRIRRNVGELDIEFRAKGDRESFATALASIGAKYVRERAMAELNDWYCSRHDGLKRTAGYPQDARRWLEEVRGAGDGDTLALVVRER